MKSLKVIKNPKDKELKLKATCAIIGRKPKESDKDEFKTAFVSLYDQNNAHKTGAFQTKMYEFTNIEKIRFKGLNVSYYLEGNDIIINDLEELFVIKEGPLIILKGYQFEVERRK